MHFTPDQIVKLFDANAAIIMFVWGLACKYLPVLAKIPNATIPWVNALAYIVAALAGQHFIAPAHADTGEVAQTVGIAAVTLTGFLTSILTGVIYDKLLNPFLKHIGVQKAEAR